jgi:hypothetical protein
MLMRGLQQAATRPPHDVPACAGARAGYTVGMPRFAPAQPDLFAPPPAAPPPESDPMAELTATLAMLRDADRLPWPNLTEAMAQEYRVMHLARLAGSPGEALARAIFEQTERLFAATDRPPAR